MTAHMSKAAGRLIRGVMAVGLACAITSAMAPQAAARTEHKTLKSAQPAPPGGYKELEAGQFVDRDDKNYKIDLLPKDQNDPRPGSYLKQLDVDDRVVVLPPGDQAFDCTQTSPKCIGKDQAESRVVQLRVAPACDGSNDVMRSIVTDHEHKATNKNPVSVSCTALPPPPPAPVAGGQTGQGNRQN